MTTVGVYQKLARASQATRADYRRQLVEQLYHAMLNARLDELTQKADPPFLVRPVSTTGGLVRSVDIYLQAAGVEEGDVEGGLEALLTEVERVDRHGFTATELERAKTDLLRSLRAGLRASGTSEIRVGTPPSTCATSSKTNRCRASRTSWSWSRSFCRHQPRGAQPTGGQWISDGNRVVLVAGPERQDQAVADETELARILEDAAGANVEPYVDVVLEQPLLARIPESSEIIERREIPEIGVTEWLLGNGVRVVLKPTEFKNDQVLLTGFSPGGDSLVTDDDFVSASFATSVAGEGGLGEFSSIELEKALAGRVASAGAYIGELEEGIQASASPRDMETMFQLVYLTFTEPRRDAEAFDAFVARIRAFLVNRRARPEAVFSDELSEVVSQGHFRRRPPTLEMVDEIDLDTALAVYSDRFADAGDFTFVLVGNFDLEAVAPFVETYLGGLPSLGRAETWRDIGVRVP